MPVRSAKRPGPRASVLLPVAAVAVTGITVGSGLLTHDTAPADTATGTTSVRPVVTRVSQPIPAAERAQEKQVSRSAGRPALDRADKQADRQADKRADRRAGKPADRNGGRSAEPRGKDRPAKQAEKDPRQIARDMLPEFGFAASQFGCLDALYVSESDWEVDADNPTSSAYGIPQALTSAWDLPPDYRTNAATQIEWGLDYIRKSYGTPCAAWEFKQANNWY